MGAYTVAKGYLTSEQQNILRSCRAGINLAADLAHAEVFLYVKEEDPKYINIYAEARPLTEYVEQKFSLTGRKLRLTEEPLVQRAMQSEFVVSGKRESTLGSFVGIRIFPVFDSKRNCFAAVAFEKNLYDGEYEEIFLDIARQFLFGFEQRLLQEENYQRLSPSDGLLIVGHNKVIKAANNTAKHIFSVLGVPKVVGMRTNSQQINWPLVGMVLKAGIAESKEVEKNGRLLTLRVLPVLPQQDTPLAIVIINDITELKQK